MSASDEAMEILQNVWTKLQALPQAHPFTQTAFLIILLFFLTFIALFVTGCVYGRCGCCASSTKNRVSAV
ncbi:small integral membrane protein 5 [Puntigrus tetrazona]|uniref:small integral membrane protein 5 n=1 Tax=Puntigrus tetrazona TaxID=1606681 RepID=UPI001C88F93C|nr:small integral membrane protein 5 [Puntigrus tetrazona]XP_043091693.1 small integral membrane protein 5 [Puntigrus tetrazona]